MAALQNRPHVPKFGDWEVDSNTPFTAVFDNARKGRTDGRMINPNDPQENPDMFAKHGHPPKASPSRNITEPEEQVGTGRGAVHEGGYSKDDGKVDDLGRRASDESQQQQKQGGRVSNSGRTARPRGESVHSIERSPAHPQHQPKLGERGSGSPALEGKNSYNSHHGTPGRSNGRSASRGDDETPNRGTVLPKFGGWDETDPPSADNYRDLVFDKCRASFAPGRDPHLMNKPCAPKASFPPGRDPHLMNDRSASSAKVSCSWRWWK